jgi:hypothetical protein
MPFPFSDVSLDWRRICRAAGLEQNPEKLSQIVQRINAALRARQQMLRDFAKGRRVSTSQHSSRLGRAA